MIDRYSRPPMRALWSYENQLATWLEVELLICEGLAETGHIPGDAGRRIRAGARFEAARVLEIEERVRHDVAAFVEAVGESLGEDARYFHWGVTSSDVVDTALAVRARRAGLLLL
jgi:adenylosuccinate lyase